MIRGNLERRQQVLDPAGLLDKEPRGNRLFTKLDAGGPAPDRLENDLRKRFSPAQAAVGDEIQPFHGGRPRVMVHIYFRCRSMSSEERR